MISFKVYCQQKLIEEGGAYGHLQNIWDVDDFTFADLKDLIKDSLQGNLENISEKTDGQNIMFSYINDELKFARNKTQLKKFGEQSLSVKDFKDKYSTHENKGLAEAWVDAADDLENALDEMNPKKRSAIFQDGKFWVSAEILSPKSENVIPYGLNQIIFHSIHEIDDNGNMISEDVEIVKSLIKDLIRYGLDKQKVYTLRQPHDLKVKSIDDTKAQSNHLIKELDGLQALYKVLNTDTIFDMKKAALIEKMPKIEDEELQKKLIGRWLKTDSANINQIKKLAGDKFDDIKAFDDSIDKVLKQIMLPLEKLFIRLGSNVLKNIDEYLTTDDKAKEKMKKNLDEIINTIEKSDDVKLVEKLKLELDRLESAGGVENIIPSEGIVFKYKGKTLKFTGAFAPLNQIMGLRFKMKESK